MWATTTTTPRYALMKEQLQKETWTPYTWSFANSKCGGGMWVPEVSSFLNSYLVLELVYVLASCSIKKMKKMGGVVLVTILSPSTRCRGKYSQCPAFDIKQSPAGRSPEDHQVRAHAYLSSNKAQSCFVLPLSVLICFSSDVYPDTHL